MQGCPDLTALQNGQSKTLATWILNTADAYRQCQQKQAYLSTLINQLKEQQHGHHGSSN